jgi:ribonuclease-3 family protein
LRIQGRELTGKLLNKGTEMSEREFLESISGQDEEKMLMYSPSQLAYIGDSIYEILVRSYIIKNSDVSVNQMHRHTIKFVKAKSQAELVKNLDPIFTEEEKRIIKRGRNAKVTSSPKNAELMDYRYATGFEALMGYLYLNRRFDRLMEIFDAAVENVNKKDGNK